MDPALKAILDSVGSRPDPRSFQPPKGALDPLTREDIVAWEQANMPQQSFPITPGKYGQQLRQAAVQEYVPSPADSPDSGSYKVIKALMSMGGTSPGGSPGTLAAIKAKGGMWHPDAAERLSQPLKLRLAHGREDHIPPPDDAFMLQGTRVPEYDWADKAVKNYLNKHAGTAEDPIKDVVIPYGNDVTRIENITDSMLYSKPAHEVRPTVHPSTPPNEPVWHVGDMTEGVSQRYNQWLEKNNLPKVSMDELHPEGSGHDSGHHDTYNALTSQQRNELQAFANEWEQAAEGPFNPLGQYMGHVGDYMRNIPAAELPRYDLVRAVRETAAADAARAKKMNSVEGKLEGTLPHKQYPDKFQWVEVKSKDALKNEGDTMGHCVGGYCDYVESGHSKIYSLRDPKGASHVTIEVHPNPEGYGEPGRRQGVIENVADRIRVGVDNIRHPEPLPTIAQIKGKQNLSPSDEYLPYVQDFIKSGKWKHVGDLEHTGMVQHQGRFLTHAEAIPEGIANIKKELTSPGLTRKVGWIGGHHPDQHYIDQLNKNLRDLEFKRDGKLAPDMANWKSALYFALDLGRTR